MAANLLLSEVGGLESSSLYDLPKVLAGQGLGGYIDVGAGHPSSRNNTYLFYRLGMRGIAVDPIAVWSEAWAAQRPGDHFICAAASSRDRRGTSLDFWIFDPYVLSTCDPLRAQDLATSAVLVERRTVTSITLEELQATSQLRPALVSVDVEAAEQLVIDGLDLVEKRPKLIVVEICGLIAHGGVARTPTYRMLSDKAYSLKAMVGSNFFFLDVADGDPVSRHLPLGEPLGPKHTES